MSDSLRLHESQHARPPCPSPSPGVHSDSSPLSQWCHPAISSCRPLLLLPSIPPSIRVFSNESTLCMRWPEYWSFSFSIIPSKEHPGLISFIFFFNLNSFILIGGWLLYNIVLVLPYINMNPPRVYTCSQSWTPLPSLSPYHPSGSSQCTSPKHPVSCTKPRLVICFLYDIIHVSMPFSQIKKFFNLIKNLKDTKTFS